MCTCVCVCAYVLDLPIINQLGHVDIESANGRGERQRRHAVEDLWVEGSEEVDKEVGSRVTSVERHAVDDLWVEGSEEVDKEVGSRVTSVEWSKCVHK